MNKTLLYKIEKIEKKVQSIDKGLWSLRANFLKVFTAPTKLGKGRLWGFPVTDQDINEAKKALFDFDIAEYVTKRELAAWAKKR